MLRNANMNPMCDEESRGGCNSGLDYVRRMVASPHTVARDILASLLPKHRANGVGLSLVTAGKGRNAGRAWRRLTSTSLRSRRFRPTRWSVVAVEWVARPIRGRDWAWDPTSRALFGWRASVVGRACCCPRRDLATRRHRLLARAG